LESYLISERLNQVREEISMAEKKSGRPPGSAKLIAVSKTFEKEFILEAIQSGCLTFGENRIQEAKDKIEAIGRNQVKWHFIGHLQKNKVKFIYDLFDLIHSVDSFELGQAIHQGAKTRGVIIPALIQVNIASEVTKSGTEPSHLEELLNKLSNLSGLQIKGLMTIPPLNSDPEKSRQYFAQLRELRDKMVRSNIANIELNELSMGMSGDYKIAIEEGATFVRVGSAIFGKRTN
jgi:pyridoxal phosphate enzyme (YggS family)